MQAPPRMTIILTLGITGKRVSLRGVYAFEQKAAAFCKKRRKNFCYLEPGFSNPQGPANALKDMAQNDDVDTGGD